MGSQFGIVADNSSAVVQQQFVFDTRSQPVNGQGAVAYFDNVEVVPVPGSALLGMIGLAVARLILRNSV